MGFIWIVVAGAAAGWAVGRFMTPNEYGPVGDIVVGVAGALVATLLFRFFGPAGGVGIVGGLIIVVAGATLLLFTARRFMKPEPAPAQRTRRRF